MKYLLTAIAIIALILAVIQWKSIHKGSNAHQKEPEVTNSKTNDSSFTNIDSIPNDLGIKQNLTQCTNAIKSSSFYKEYSGKIGDDVNVTFQITKIKNSIYGSYSHELTSTPLTFKGSIDENCHFELLQYDGNKNVIGKFKGYIIDLDTIYGDWFTQDLELPFKICAKPESEVIFHYKEFSSKNCDRKNRMSKLPKDSILWTTDTLCSTVDLKIIEIETKDKNISKLINRSIETFASQKNRSVDLRDFRTI